MDRRQFLFTFGSIVIANMVSAKSQAASRISVFKDLVEALGAAGDAIVKLTDGFKHLIVTGNQGYSYVAAERERDRLINISRKVTNLITFSNVPLVESIDEYLELSKPAPDDWERVRRNVEATLSEVNLLLNDVRHENSEFVLESAYFELSMSLKSRGIFLGRLVELPPPSTPEDLIMLRQANEKYKALIINSLKAVEELNKYIKTRKQNG